MSTLYLLLISIETIMVGQLGDFQRLNVQPTPDLATFSKSFGSRENIDFVLAVHVSY